MEQLLLSISLIILVTAFFDLINEKFLHLTVEISLLLQSAIIALVFFLLKKNGIFHFHSRIINYLSDFDLNEYLVKGVLCLMLFSGATHINFHKLKENARAITVFSFLSTFLSAVIYGGLFYLVLPLIGMKVSLSICLLFGAIVSPTDPIAATGILPKLGLPKRTGLIIEAESLFNDGVGVALFVCFLHMVSHDAGESFCYVLFKELLGGVGVGLILSAITFYFFRISRDEHRQIFFSLGTVIGAYAISEMLNVSCAIAAVTCGIFYSSCVDKYEIHNHNYEIFWDVIDNLLNRVLYIIIGFYVIYVLEMPHRIPLAILTIVINFIARFLGVYLVTFVAGELPDNFSKLRFSTLLTWGGLRGGLCLAMALSTYIRLPREDYLAITGCVYILVFFTTVIQGLTIGKVYEKIKS